MLEGLRGTAHLYGLIGRPADKVESPAGLAGALRRRGREAVVVPIQVEPEAFDDLLESLGDVRNLDGILAAAPHRAAAWQHAATTTDRARWLSAASILRRNPDRTWHADMLDGEGLTAAISGAGGEPARQRALIAGAGAAGGAIALSLLDAGVSRLAVHDIDAARRDALIERLQARYGTRAAAGSADPAGFTLMVNATPAGARAGDPLPLQVDALVPGMIVADLATATEETPLLAAARRCGCVTHSGARVFEAALGLMAEFLTAPRR